MALTVAFAAALLLAGCNGGASAAHPAVEATAGAARTGAALVASASATPSFRPPASIGGAPATPSGASAASSGAGEKYAGLEPQLSAMQLYAVLQQAKLPVRDGTEVTPASDPDQKLGKPGGYESRVDFLDTSLAPSSAGWSLNGGGALEVFASDAEARRAMKALDSANATHPTEHDHLSRTVILRLSMNIAADQQSAYGLAIKRAVEDDLKRQYRAASVPSPTPVPAGQP